MTKNERNALREEMEDLCLKAVRDLIRNPGAANGDKLKAIALYTDHLREAVPAGMGEGDFTLRLGEGESACAP